VVGASWADTSSDPTVSDTSSNVWNALPVLRGPAGQGALSIKLFYAMNIAGGTTTITLNSSPGDVGIHAVEYSGVATSNALDVTNTAVSNGNTTTTPTSGSFTPTAGDLVYAYFGDEALAQTSITAGTGYTIVSTTGNHVDASENNLEASSGAQTASFTLGTASQSWALYVAAFKASGGSALLCGTADDGLVHLPPSYSCSSPPCSTNPFPPPAKGSTYVDPQYGCTVKRLTDAVGDGLSGAAHHQYGTITPINANDSYVMVLMDSGNMEIVDTSGGVIVPIGSFPNNTNTADVPWDISIPTRFYYAAGATLFRGDITGLPGCASTHNCTVTSAVLHDFTGTYTNVQIPDQEDLSDDGDHLWLVGDNSAFLYTISTNTMGTAMNVGTKDIGNGWHKIQIMPSNRMLMTWGPNGHANGLGQEVYNTDTTLNWHMFDNSLHTDCGRDLSGNEVCVVGRIPDTGGGISGVGACPTWTGTQDGGVDVINMTTHGAQCLVDVNWADTEISFRDGNANGGWVFITFFKDQGRTPCPTYSCFDTTSPSHLDTSWATNWVHFAEEGILVRIDNNNRTAHKFRLFHTRSRSTEYYWAIPRGAISRDGRYLVFDSNFDIPPAPQTNYADVYGVGIR